MDKISPNKALGCMLLKKCNAFCPFCIWKYACNEDYKTEISLERFEKYLKLGKKAGYNFISLSGGEICLHSKFKEIIKLCVKYQFKFSFVSNGKQWEEYKFILEQ